MPRARHYVPCIHRAIVCALYHEAKRRHKPMTTLVNDLLTHALEGTPGWQTAQEAHDASLLQEHPATYDHRPSRR